MKKQIVILTLSISLISFGVNAQNPDSEKGAKTEKSISKANADFQQHLESVYKANLKLNEAFVTSDAAKVKEAVKPVRDAVENVNKNHAKENAPKSWITYSRELDHSLKQIENTENIKEQRKQFSSYNETLYKAIKEFGTGGADIYFQHCPMALNNEGASWLSNSKEIRNPYYGDKMLKCGIVKETL